MNFRYSSQSNILGLNHHCSGQKLERISKKKLIRDIFVTHLLTEKYSHHLIKSMVNLIQFPMETSRLNLKISLVLQIIKVYLYWDIIIIIHIFDLKNDAYVNISMEYLFQPFHFIII